MKLPFDFGIKLIFRLVIPGFLLSLGFFPLLNLLLKLNGWTDKAEYAFVILIILLGWLITISDMGIYMLLEGRRFWPWPIRAFANYREEQRLARLKRETQSSDERISSEAYFDIRNFPMTADGEYEVALPSRLGNLLYAFERHSKRNYGVDPIFYWPRIWLKLDKDAREEVDNMQALADSTTYTTFALLMSGLLWLLYALVKYLIVLVLALCTSLAPRVQYDLGLVDQLLPRKGVAFIVAGIFLLAAFTIYRLSLYLHAQYGEFFKSIFDLNVANLGVSAIIKELSNLSAESPSVTLSPNPPQKDQFLIAARYLQYYRYRCPNPACHALLKISEIKTHHCPYGVGGCF
jgi:hypothetical protein